MGDIFDLTQPLTKDNLCVGNDFAKTLVKLVKDAYSKEMVIKIDIGDRKKRKGSVNVANMPALTTNTFQTITQEVAFYRSMLLSFSPLFNLREHEGTLFIDYLLAMSLCYVEIDNPKYNPNQMGSQRVDKFFATRNINIAKALCNLDSNKETRARNYLQTLESEYSGDSLRILKLNPTKAGYSLTQPRNAVKLGKNVRIMPIVLLQVFSTYIEAQLRTGILEFTYRKDDRTTRVLNSTLNPSIFMKYYKDAERWNTVSSNVSAMLNRGYIKIPELGLSKYDESGVRSLNLMRVERMRKVDDIDSSFIAVDINCIVDEFKKAVDEAYTKNTIQKLYNFVMRTEISVDKMVARDALNNWVDTQVMVGSTTFLKSLHNAMIANKELFPKYTGTSTTTNIDYTSLFGDLGV